MMCNTKFGERAHQKNLLEAVDTFDITSFLVKFDQRGNDRTKLTSEKRNQFLTGWETGVDSQLTPPKVIYSVKPIARQQKDQQPSFLYKAGGGANGGSVGGIRSKPFVFVQSLSSEAYLKHYTNEHSYLANLYATGTPQQQQQQLLLRQAPSIGGFPVRLSSPPPFLAPPPPLPPPQPQPQPPPQIAAARIGSAGSGRVTRLFQQQQAASEQLAAAVPMGQQVDLLTKKIVPASYFIISGRPKPEAAAADRRLEPLTLLTERTFKFLADSSAQSSRKTPKLEAKTGTPRLTNHSKPRVPTAERARLRDFSSAHFGPALQQRLRQLIDAETTLVNATANSASKGSTSDINSASVGLEISGVSRGNSRLSEVSGQVGASRTEMQGLITAGMVGANKSQRWFDSATSAARPTPYVAAARFGDVRRK